MVTYNSLGFLIGSYNINYEASLTDKCSLTVGATYFSFLDYDYQLRYIGTNLGTRYYFNTVTEGFYVGPMLTFANITDCPNELAIDKEQQKSITFGIVGTTGYQWILKNGFTCDFNLGLGYYLDSGLIPSTYFPTLGIKLGQAF